MPDSIKLPISIEQAWNVLVRAENKLRRLQNKLREYENKNPLCDNPSPNAIRTFESIAERMLEIRTEYDRVVLRIRQFESELFSIKHILIHAAAMDIDWV